MRLVRAFTLLETMIALAILGVSLVAIFDINTMAVNTHVYAKRLTVATLLARSKMIDIEQELYDKGFQTDDDEQAGDFSDEGWSSYKWRAKIIAPKTNGMSPDQLIGAIFNLPIGGGDGKDGSPGGLGALGSLFGGSGGAAAGGLGALGGLAGAAGASGGGGSSILSALGPAGGLATTQFQQLVDQLTKSVREVHLTVTWKEGKQTESFDIVTHVVSMGVGTSPDRNGGAAAVQSAQASQNGQPAPDQWVNAQTGQVVSNPAPAPNGQGMVDPSTGQPLMQYAQWLATRGGGAGQPGPGSLANPGQIMNTQPGLRNNFLGGGLGNLPQRVRPFGQ